LTRINLEHTPLADYSWMKLNPTALSTSTLMLAAASSLQAQYTPPPPPAPFPGFINEWLRKDDPYMNKWDFGGSVRGRYEVKDDYGIPGIPGSVDFRAQGAEVDNDFFLERIRLRGGYTDKWWSVLVEGQASLAQSDARFAYPNIPPVPGTVQRKGDGPEADVIELHQAYFTVGNHKEFPLSAKIGRQEVVYGDDRLIGTFAWNNIGRTWDMAKGRWQNEWFWVDFFTGHPVIPQDNVFDVPNTHDWFSGFWANTTKIEHHSLDFYFLARNASAEAAAEVPSPQFPQPSQRDIYTVGARFKSMPGELGNCSVDAIGQFGSFYDPRPGAPNIKLDQMAYAVIVQGGYTFKDLWGTPRLGLEFDYSSGDKDPFDDQHQTLDNLYPTNHKFYGYMDFFSLQNMVDLRMIFTIKPTPRLSIAIEGHAFWLANTHDSFYNVAGVARGGVNPTPGNGYGVNPGYGSFVGNELDIVAGYALTRYAQVEVGYGHFFVGSYIQSSLSSPAFGATDANFFYTQLNVNY
jgi:hypothetical protein